MRVAVIALLVGCGRLAFTALPDAGGSSGDGMADASEILPATCGAFAQGWQLQPGQPIASLASTANDTKPYLSPDGLTLYFISDRAGTDDVWKATRTVRGGAFTGAARVNELSSNADESGISLRDDGLEAFITSNRPGSANHDVWIAQLSGDGGVFNPPTLVIGGVNTVSWEYEPTSNRTGETLYLVTENYPGFPGGGDPVFSTRDGPSSFVAPMLVAEMASANNEYGFTVSRDGLVAMVASDRGALGESYIYVSARSSPAVAFPPPARMSQLEMSTDNGHAILSDDGCEILFASFVGGRYQLHVARWHQL